MIMLTNTGGLALHLQSTAITGNFSIAGAGTTLLGAAYPGAGRKLQHQRGIPGQNGEFQQHRNADPA